MDRSSRLDAAGWWLLALGAGSLANGLWMLAAPMHWYQELPAGVPDTGPFNAHFVRDIGCAFLAVGTALAWAALRPRWRVPLVTIATLFYLFHGALHVYDTMGGALDGEHWALDLPGVYLPAVLLLWLTLRLRARAAEGGA